MATVKGAGTVSSSRTYSVSEKAFTDGPAYYRLKQIDADGKTEVFDIITTDCNTIQEQLLLYPNPATDAIHLELSLSKNYGNGELKILDNIGNICFSQTLILNKGKISYQLPLNLLQGAYTLVISSSQVILPAQKLIIK